MTETLFPPEAEQMFTPDSVTPGVMYLVSEDAPTGVILCAGAGHFAVAQMVESDGAYLGRDGLSAEKVADAWAKISDMSHGKAYFMGNEQTEKFFAKASGK